MPISSYWAILKDAGLQWSADKAPRMGAAVAFYAIFSIAPFLVIAIAIAGFIFGEEAARGQVAVEVEQLLGQQAGEAIGSLVASASQPGKGTLGTVLGIGMLLFGAAGLFTELQDSLNTVWEVRLRSDRWWWGFIRGRFLSLALVLGVAFLLLVSLVASAGLSALGGLLGKWHIALVGQLINTVLDLVVITVLFAAIFRYLPDAEIAWRDVWLGALVTSALFSLGKFLMGLYLGRTGLASAYGASGSLAVLLLWIYYAAQIFLFGAELTKAYATQVGSRLKPKPHAEPATAEARAQEGLAPAPINR